MHSRPNDTGRLSFALICCAAQMLRERHTLVSFGGYMREGPPFAMSAIVLTR